MKDKKLLLGIDGGGTKTEFVLFDEEGHALRRLVLAGSNPNSAGVDGACDVLCEGIGKMLQEKAELAGAYAGVAGCSNPAHRQAICARVAQRFPGLPFAIESDMLNVMSSAECGDKCITAIMGTGAVVFARAADGMHRLGGWGWRFEGGGSGYDIGRDAIRAVLSAYEGLGPKTLLTPMLEEKIGGDLWENVNRLYAMQPDEIASFTPVVLQAWDEGDVAAGDILCANMARMAMLISAAAEKYDCGDTLVISGGLSARRDMLEKYLFPGIPASLAHVVPDMPQIFGACRLCVQKYADLGDDFRKNFEKSYTELKGELAAC